MLKETEKRDLVKRAKDTAKLYMHEFKEPFDECGASTWDYDAFCKDARSVYFSSNDWDQAWKYWRSEFIAETIRLYNLNPTSIGE